MRQIVLDTETTGLDPEEGHRLIEIGCVELIDRRLTRNNFHLYLQPDRQVDADAIKVHGITDEMLADKPRFGDIVTDLISYLSGAELVIHNAAFDLGFINHELRRARADVTDVTTICSVIDTLKVARKTWPGQRNSLDALCRRLGIDNSRRTLHGALLDAEILSDVYLLMTGGQTSLSLGGGDEGAAVQALDITRGALPVVLPDEGEQAEHQAFLQRLQDQGNCRWQALWGA